MMKALLLVCLVTSVAKANHPHHHHHHMSHSTGSSGQFVHSLAYKLPGAASFFRIKQVFPRYGHFLNSIVFYKQGSLLIIVVFFLQKHNKGFGLLFLASLDLDA